MPAFGQELFAYITTLVPYWRVCDEAWALGKGDQHLTGIGVLRNYGGQAMVMPWDDDTSAQLARFRAMLAPVSDRIIVIVNDREIEDLEGISAMVFPISVLPWSRRDKLASVIIKDSAD